MDKGMDKGILALVIVLIILVVITLAVLIYFLIKKNKPSEVSNNTEVLESKLEGQEKLYQEKFDNLNKTISSVQQVIDAFKNSSSEKDSKFVEQLTNANKDLETLKTGDDSLVKKFDAQHETINNKIAELDKTVKTIQQIANYQQTSVQDIDQKLSNLNNIFIASNKKRGNLGEYILNKLLEDIYGSSKDLWEEQYKMPDGNIIDALIKTGDNKENIAVDSKFPLDNYNRYVEADNKDDENRYLNAFKQDIKSKIKEVKKYISKKNNISNAVMFVPSEELFGLVYREFPDVVDDALKDKVWITSPTTLAALLSLIDSQNADAKLNKNLGKVKEQLLGLKEEFDRFSKRWDDIKSNRDKFSKSIDELDKTVVKIENKYEKIYDQSELNNTVEEKD